MTRPLTKHYREFVPVGILGDRIAFEALLKLTVERVNIVLGIDGPSDLMARLRDLVEWRINLWAPPSGEVAEMLREHHVEVVLPSMVDGRRLRPPRGTHYVELHAVLTL